MSSPKMHAPPLDPPQPFTYTDWVVRIPISQIPQEESPETARDVYQENLWKKLVRVVESRIGQGRCFYSFLPGQSVQTKRPGQIEVTKLYAFHEVKHWPGACEQLQWTSFVLANIEYDDLIKEHGSNLNITLPVLPSAAVRMYQVMKRDQDQDLARICAEAGTTIGQMVGGEVSLYTTGSERLSPIGIVASETANMNMPSIGSSPSSTPTAPDKQSDMAQGSHISCDWTVEEIVEDEEKFHRYVQLHATWTRKATSMMQMSMVRCICRLPGMEDVAFKDCWIQARQRVHGQAETFLRRWRVESPRFTRNPSRSSGNWLERQLKSLLASIAYRHPIAASATALSPVSQAVLRRRHFLVAMARQRQILATWAAQVKKAADCKTGVRYRREHTFVLDLWTGKIVKRKRESGKDTDEPMTEQT
ncbi:hypothetical protein A1O3_02174 [Capronia epimyces CBS 606.96]|uniref:Uncharacterized protein n=1 Tax=Capronia epimyces CBS 606.96 TaxID=1182542 RepID=W9YHG6_9EURO|nr:uncharacterized protein A1O3_02174 [Capronia epimyces CBS 606.96]EXJ89110.1 hypothetical protein A1O3_02174 [Capronia epimyces CBS 606.96]